MTRRKYFLRYLAVFGVPVLLLGALLWANNIWYTYRETAALRNTALVQMIEAMDLLAGQTQAVADKAGANADLTAARRGVTGDYAQVSQWLTLYENLFTDEVTLAYYIPGDNRITLHDGAIPYGDFESRHANAADFSLAGYYKTLNQSGRSAASNLSRSGDSFYAFSYTHPITNRQARHVGTLCFLVPRAELRSMFGRYFPEDSARLYILDAANKPVYCGEDGMPTAQALAKTEGIGLVEEDGSNVVLRGVSNQSRYSYFVVMPKKDFYAAGSTGMTFLLALELVLILFSADVAILLTRSHYANLQRIHGQNLQLEDALDAQGDVIRTLVLRKLIDGSHKDQAVMDYNLRCANIQFYHPHYFVLVADFAGAADEDAEMAAFHRAFEGKSRPELYSRTVLRPELRQAAIIINTAFDQRALAQEVAALLAEAGIRAPTGLSRHHQTCLRLNNAYIEAAVAISERLSPLEDRLFLFTGAEDSARGSQLPTLEHTIIQESIRNGNRELLGASVDTLFEKINLSSHHPQIARLACFDVINLCVRQFAIFDSPLSPQAIAGLSDFESPAALAGTVRELLFQLLDTVQEHMSNAVASTKYNLIGFVQENFRNSNLSLSLLADEFGLSHSYISKLFKEETGQNFLSYVKQLRMSYVKKQLIETDKQVKDIILDTGYVDVANFTRTFKQEVGITPLQYRHNIRESG